MRRGRRLPDALLFGVALAAWTAVALTAVRARGLRPLSDDYCHAAESAPGFFTAVAFWYQSWIGDVAQVSLTTLLVGLPLAELPLEIASLIPFLFTALAMAAVVLVVVLARGRGERRSRLVATLVVLPLGMLAWWGFWWISAVVDPDPSGAAVSLGLTATSWQTVNVQYAIVPALVVIAIVVLDRRGPHPIFDAVAFALLGVVVGLSGLVLAAGVLAAVPLVVIARFVLDAAVHRHDLVRAISLLVGGAVGLLIAGLSPGIRNRTAAADPPLDPVTPGGLLHWVLPEGILIWLDGILTPGTVLAAVIGAAIALVLRAAGIRPDIRHVALAALGVGLLALVVAVAARGAEAFSYVAVWHQFMPRGLIFVAAMLAGVALGGRLLELRGRSGVLAVGAAAGVALALAIGGVLTMHSQIEARLAAWEIGAAPGGGPDIETGWVADCAERWSDDRELPMRRD